ncbi:hypothetical protein GGU11DRAFT_694428 [Lentinula aff. detonsa]|nr:hypothetical protein GGU11DRAFT_694428 [Lentinula aff. detonsa]
MLTAHIETCIQLTVDGGSETGEMYACHTVLLFYMPHLTRPTFVALPSTKNVVIERSWGHWLKFRGQTLRAAIQLGREQQYFNPADELHISLFNWIWPKIVQQGVNDFVTYWNDHKTRTQKIANTPSGCSPNLVFDFPQNYGLLDCGIRVDQEDIAALRETIPRTREECYRWVSDEFDAAAKQAYAQLGSPTLSHTNGWQLFIDMARILG